MAESEKPKRAILIGRTFAGKTTICQFLNDEALRYCKTQSVTVAHGRLIDTPGEYLERFWIRGTLQVTSADADIIIFVQDATEGNTMFPPAYASIFPKPVLGVVTKSDLATEEEIEHAKQFLELAGVREIFVTSSYEGTGFAPLIERLGYKQKPHTDEQNFDEDESQKGGNSAALKREEWH